MTLPIEQAKAAGYSDEEIYNFLSKKKPELAPKIKKAREAGYTPDEINKFLSSYKSEDTRTLRERTKAGAAHYGAGVAGGAGGFLGDVLNLAKPLMGVLGSQLAPSIMPKGTHELTEQIEKGFDVDEPVDSLERILKQSGQWGGQEGVFGTAIGGPVGAGAGLAHGSASGAFYQGLKELGLDDEWALGLTMLATASPIAFQKLLPKIEKKIAETKAIGKRPPLPPDDLGGIGTLEIKRMPSGLSEPRAVESQYNRLATISPEREKHAIELLNKEASALTKTSVEKHLPLSKKIEEGFDFEHQFERDFGRLKKTAEKYDPTIDITPISQFLEKTASQYRGIPTPHPEAKLIIQEIKNFRKKTQTSLNNLLKIYRSNNKKQKSIFETARLTGKQQEYSDFLATFNKAISDSFARTLPEDSAWMNKFLESNRTYKNYLDTKKTLNQLNPVLEGNVTVPRLNRLLSDARQQKKLELSMGKAGAQEVLQIARDLKRAIEAIKKIPKKDIKVFDHIFPVSVLLPVFKVPSAARNLYGYWLSSPARRIAYDEAIKALGNKNIEAYKAATDNLKKELPFEEQKLIQYKPE